MLRLSILLKFRNNHFQEHLTMASLETIWLYVLGTPSKFKWVQSFFKICFLHQEWFCWACLFVDRCNLEEVFLGKEHLFIKTALEGCFWADMLLSCYLKVTKFAQNNIFSVENINIFFVDIFKLQNQYPQIYPHAKFFTQK